LLDACRLPDANERYKKKTVCSNEKEPFTETFSEQTPFYIGDIVRSAEAGLGAARQKNPVSSAALPLYQTNAEVTDLQVLLLTFNNITQYYVPTTLDHAATY
jgi:hypothetical protein